VKSESSARGGVITMTLDDVLNGGLSSRWSVCSVWMARLAGMLSVVVYGDTLVRCGLCWLGPVLVGFRPFFS
jgi:hypothetical protein